MFVIPLFNLKQEGKMNIPNMLTIVRLCLIPFFIATFFGNDPNSLRDSMIIFAVAGITDVLDGYIARKYNLVTDLGTVLDPLADKLMLIAVLSCFTIRDYIPTWIIGVVLVKELTMIAGGIYLYFHKEQIVIPANKFGKLATVFFYTAIILITFNVKAEYNQYIIGIAMIMTLVAFFVYTRSFKKMYDQKKEEN